MAASSLEIDGVFILRFWRERSVEGRALAPWRAHIIEVHTGKKFPVGSVDDALNFVRNQLADAGEIAMTGLMPGPAGRRRPRSIHLS